MAVEATQPVVPDRIAGNHLTERQRTGRDEILVAAAAAFSERGFAATSIDDIADRLHCTKGRIYHYFRTKGEVFLGIHWRAMELCFAAVRPVATSDRSPAERLRGMVVAHALLMMQEASFMHLAVQHAEMSLITEGRTRKETADEVFSLRREYEEMFVDVIRAGVEGGTFRKVDPGLMAKAALGSLNWMSIWYQPASRPRRRSPESIADSFAAFIVNGLLEPQHV